MLRFLGTDRSQRTARAIDSVCILVWIGALIGMGYTAIQEQVYWFAVPLPVIAVAVITACIVAWRWERVGGALLVIVGLIGGGMALLGLVYMVGFLNHFLVTGELRAHWQDIAPLPGLGAVVVLLVTVPPVLAGIFFLRYAARATVPGGDWMGPLARAIDLAGILTWAGALLGLFASISGAAYPLGATLSWALSWWSELGFVPALVFIAAALAAWRWERVGGRILVVLGLLLGAVVFWGVAPPVSVWTEIETYPEYFTRLVFAALWACFLAVPPITDGTLFMRHAKKLAAPPAAA
ncbi:MAG: hypothetical protein U0641_12640 [Anaerolineae bacterium]